MCDILAVFENHVFIFFDRESRKFTDSDKDTVLTWDRWKRTVIDAQTRSVHGAEKYIRSNQKIFLNKEMTTPFPIAINTDHMIVHKIVVAHGAKEACEKFSDKNVSGSLAVSYHSKEHPFPFPFMVSIDKANPVHVLDTHNLPIIFNELDTVVDFAAYFDAKIKAINAFDLSYCGEEDLLAHYFSNFNEETNEHYIGPKKHDATLVFIGEGEWKGFVDHPAYKKRKEADRPSYLWDEIIQHTCQNALDGTLLGDPDIFKRPSAIQEMAKEPRFMRRAFADKITEAIQTFPESDQPLARKITFIPSYYRDKAYVFLQLKADKKDSRYRTFKQTALSVACGAAKNKFDHLKTVIGIAIDAPKYAGESNGEDFVYLDCENWTSKERAYFERENKLWGFFNTSQLKRQEIQVSEFPSP